MLCPLVYEVAVILAPVRVLHLESDQRVWCPGVCVEYIGGGLHGEGGCVGEVWRLAFNDTLHSML